MKKLATLIVVAVVGLSLAPLNAEAARRLGGGKSVGMQRDSISAQKPATPPSTPAQNTATNPSPMQSAAAPAAAAQAKRSWMGPLAGLAAGLGLAALASHLGFGDELASMLMIGLLVMAVLAVVGFVLRKRAAAAAPAMQPAGAGAPWSGPAAAEPVAQRPMAYASAAPIASSARSLPADFDAEGFVRQAKVSFLRLQAANDGRNLDDIREFTTPEMFGEIKAAMLERGGDAQETDVVDLAAQVLDASQDATRHIVSVHFYGSAREDGGELESIDEIWHIVKPLDGSSGWRLGGIQQPN